MKRKIKKETLRKIDWSWRILGAVLLGLFFFSIFRASKVGYEDKLVVILFVITFLLLVLYFFISAVIFLVIWINELKKKRRRKK